MGRFRSLLLDIEDFFKNLFQGTAYSTLKRAPVTAYGSNRFWYLKDITNRKSVWSFTFDHTLLYFTVQYPEFLL